MIAFEEIKDFVFLELADQEETHFQYGIKYL